MDLEKKELESENSEGVDSVLSLDEHRSKLEQLETELQKKDRELEKLRSELSGWEEKISNIRDYVKRLEAETAAVKERSQKELNSRVNQKLAELLGGFLEIQDNLERSLNSDVENLNVKSLVEGLELICKQTKESLRESGLEAISAVGEVFNPKWHEAVATQPVESDEQDDRILSELRKGYRLGDFVVRPSQVLVGKKM